MEIGKCLVIFLAKQAHTAEIPSKITNETYSDLRLNQTFLIHFLNYKQLKILTLKLLTM